MEPCIHGAAGAAYCTVCHYSDSMRRAAAGLPPARVIPEWRCVATMRSGERCRRYAGCLDRLCWQHGKRRA